MTHQPTIPERVSARLRGVELCTDCSGDLEWKIADERVFGLHLPSICDSCYDIRDKDDTLGDVDDEL